LGQGLSLARLAEQTKFALFPLAPEAIRDACQNNQLSRVLRQVPMLYAVAILNILIVMAVCAHDNLPVRQYGWMGGVALFSLFRMVQWLRRAQTPNLPSNPRQMLNMMVIVAITMMGSLSIWTSYTFFSGLFSHGVLVPISLAFGATCIAHCLAPIRTAAIGVLVLGILPIAFVMMLTGDFNARMLGISMVTIAVLMIRFVAEQYDQLVAGLMLEQQIRDQANTDALTGLANRRAIMAALEVEEATCRAKGSSFGVALLDLDGFKGVNDTLGHHVGDALLQHVSLRLQSAVAATDSVGRLGGDEFVVLFRYVESQADLSARSTAVLAALSQPVEIEGVSLRTASSLGHAMFPHDAPGIADILIAADQALYSAKRAAKERPLAQRKAA
jgi:diguanylate cyclase